MSGKLAPSSVFGLKRKEKPSRWEWKPGGFFTEGDMPEIVFTIAAVVVAAFVCTYVLWHVAEIDQQENNNDDE